ncbi:MAG: P1 family peptidase [Gemmatimonadales bacterium]|nr:P1 family peptidase [Gemmatimonadales bacterium]MYG19976.1 P1 family peptidase [Gemmatimonadales bacterium]
MRPEFAGPNVARGVALAAVGAFGGFLAAGGCVAQETSDSARAGITAAGGITAVEGLALGHFTLEERPTGCTVILAEDGAVAGVDVRGGAPGTREIALLDPVNSVREAHAIVLSGGSAFGLDAASGVVRYLEERGIGYRAGDHVVPIVAAAILFDLGIGGGSVRPGPECGYEAARAARTAAPAEGSVGAGAGATVGKLRGRGRAMKGGIGTASITLEDGLTVAAVVAVNAVGDVIDPATGEVVAGVRTEDGTGFADARALLRAGDERLPDDAPGGAPGDDASVENTTIGVVATNARLSKAEITKVAQMAHDGLARAIYPAHTPSDGDTLFGLATGTHEDDAGLSRIGALAADMVAEAILRAVRTATGLPGLPSVADLEGTGG